MHTLQTGLAALAERKECDLSRFLLAEDTSGSGALLNAQSCRLPSAQALLFSATTRLFFFFFEPGILRIRQH